MKYDEVFGFYNPETREGSIYDGSKRKDRKLSNGVIGFSIEPVWRGECTEAELIEKAKQYEENTNKNYGQGSIQLSDSVAIASN